MNKFTPLLIEIKHNRTFQIALITLGVAIPTAITLFGMYWYFILSDEGEIIVATENLQENKFIDPNQDRLHELNTRIATERDNVPQNLRETLASSRIYLQLASKDAVSQLPEPYVFEQDKFTHSTLIELVDLFHSFSPNRYYMTFFADERIPSGNSWSSFDTKASLYRYETRRLGQPAFPTLALFTENIETYPISFKRFPAISNKGEILFSGWTQTSAKPRTPQYVDLWSIFHATHDGISTQEIAQGYMPKWIDTVYVAFLKNDGLYIVDTTSYQQTRVYEATHESPIRSNESIDVTTDGSLLIWSHTSQAEIRVFDIDKKTMDITERAVTSHNTGYMHQVIFAPDGQFFALLVSGADPATHTYSDTRIEFYDTETLQIIPSATISFTNIEIAEIYMTDWVKNEV